MSETLQNEPTTPAGRSTGTSLEEAAVRIWEGVLEPPPGSEEATFFELGGQSIKAVLIVNRIQDELGVDIDVEDLFDDPDLRRFTTLVTEGAA